MHTANPLETNYPIRRLAKSLEPMWRRGWHPLDIARLIGDKEKAALNLYVDALTVSREGWHPRAAPLWAQQASSLGAQQPWWHEGPYWLQFLARHKLAAAAGAKAVALFNSVLVHPALPVLETSPYTPGSGGTHSADAPVLAKVRGLLAKAERTTFPEEAEALSAKAQQLIARHSINVALLDAPTDVPGGRRIYIDAPYSKPKFTLLAGIGSANNCQCCWAEVVDTATVVGHQADMRLTEVLFTSLLLQGTNAILAAGSQTNVWGEATTRSWRNSFWYGYAARIDQRLEDAAQSARAEHQATTQGANLLPVLAARADQVQRVFEETFPDIRRISTSVSNRDGLLAGHRFADKAELSADRSVPGNQQRQLSA